MSKKEVFISLFALVASVLVTVFLLVGIRSDQAERPRLWQEAVAQGPAVVVPYYTSEEAVGFVQGWLSEKVVVPVGGQAQVPYNCLWNATGGIVGQWAAEWDGKKWVVALTPVGGGGSKRYEFWERTWKVVSVNTGGC